jgi:hypothetical protein
MPHAAIGRAVAALALLAATAAAAQTMYKWVDEKGVTHFSESPPPDGSASKITPRVTPPSSPAAPADDWKAKDAEFRKRQIERSQKEQTDAKSAAKRQSQCDRARSRLSFLRNTGRIYRDNPDGTRTFMDESERDEEMSRAREVEREACD